MSLILRRIYESKWPQTTWYRVLVDRLWPRGISKTDAHLDLWLKNIAPSTELRKRFNHDPDKREEFQKRYTQELSHNTDAIKTLQDILTHHKDLVLLYGAKDEKHNQALVIKNYLQKNNPDK